MKNLLFVVLCIAIAGCTPGGGANQKTTYKVTGKVTMGGSPVPGATITFSPLDRTNPPAMGVTDTQGVYVLTTYDAGDGAAQGDYKVLAYKAAPTANAAPTPTHDPTGASTQSFAPSHGGGGKKGSSVSGEGGSLLPAKYVSASTTTLTKTVQASENTIDIEL